MCGISGVVRLKDSNLTNLEIIQVWETMFAATLRRGSDASGVVGIFDNKILTYKRAGHVNDLLSDERYAELRINLKQAKVGQPLALIGHSRLVTNGRASRGDNNQPVIQEDIILLHNGIVVNDSELKIRHKYQPESELDSNTIANLLVEYGVSSDPALSVLNTFKELKGNSTIAGVVRNRNSIIIATNNGSMYLGINSQLGVVAFSSERLFVQTALESLHKTLVCTNFLQMTPNTFIEIDLDLLSVDLPDILDFKEIREVAINQNRSISYKFMDLMDFSISELPKFVSLPRCTLCILPSSFPGIELNKEGICRYCSGKSAPPPQLLGVEKLLSALSAETEDSNQRPILIGVSGGRDSCFGLHYLKSVLKLNVVAYTYDWGMVTDLARRNIARICGDLGIEHIIVAPNTSTKLKNVRLNLQAWHRKPDLGVLPLLMAGDKQFFKYAHSLLKERNFSSVVLCAGNYYETTDFKTAFAGIRQKSNRGVLRDTSTWQSIKLLSYYLKAVVRNPFYLNVSLPDTISAFWSSYFLPDSYIYLFNYIPWEEEEILATLRNNYGWENAMDTSSTWRIGDGTSAFYNYVYYSVAGFTESDTFRSHQIRAGVLSREAALVKVEAENQPRWEALQWYASTVGINLEDLLNSVHSMKKLW